MATRMRIALWGNAMAANRVNLDALIPRLDFDAGPEPTTKPGDFDKIFAHDLTKGRPLYGVLRKPDFQRETAIWTPEKVRDLVVAFVEEDLVPALILWRSPTNHIFVIDGAHRLSSLTAWVNNDYGTGNLSYPFFEGQFSSHEKAAKSRKSNKSAWCWPSILERVSGKEERNREARPRIA